VAGRRILTAVRRVYVASSFVGKAHRDMNTILVAYSVVCTSLVISSSKTRELGLSSGPSLHIFIAHLAKMSCMELIGGAGEGYCPL